MRTLLAVFFAGTIAFVAAAPSAAQSPAHAEVRAVVDRLFDGMRRGDSTAVRATFHPEARLQTTTVANGQPAVRTDRIDDFVRAVGSPHPEIWDERISDVEIRVDEPVATAWMNYRFHLGTQFSHCGINAFQFFRGPSGWQILQIIDTRRQSCPQ